MLLCHSGWIVMPNTQDTTVCTEMATGRTMSAMIPIPRLRMRFWRSVPCQPRASGP